MIQDLLPHGTLSSVDWDVRKDDAGTMQSGSPSATDLTRGLILNHHFRLTQCTHDVLRTDRTGGASRQSGRRLVSFADEEAPPSSRGELSRGGLSRGGASRAGLAPYSHDRYTDDGYAAAAEPSMGDTQYYLGKYGGGVVGGGGGGGGGRMVDPRSMEMKAKMGELEQEIIRQKQQIQNLLPSAYGDAGGAGGASGYVPSRQSGVPPPVVKAPTRFAKVPRVAQEGGGGGGGRGGGGGGAGGGGGGRKGSIYRGEKELGGVGGDGRIISTSSRLIYYSGPPQPDANS